MPHTSRKITMLLRLATLAGVSLCTGLLAAQTPSWFPLEIGNTWLYSPVASNNPRISSQYRTISVHGKESLSGRDYYDVSYFGRELILRSEPSDGSIFAYDRSSESEQPFLLLGLPEGGTFATPINPCATTGEIAARDATVKTPAGEFDGAVQVKFSGTCADVGITQQFYAPAVGLLTSEETTFAGGLKYELVYFRVGSHTGTTAELSFMVAINSAHYTEGGTLHARLTLRSTGPDPIPLHFPSGQSFDLKILDAAGNEVYLWSKGRVFTLIVRDEMFGPGEKTFGLSAPLDGLAPGRYTAHGYLTTSPVSYVGQVSFIIDTRQQASAELSNERVVKPTGPPVIVK